MNIKSIVILTLLLALLIIAGVIGANNTQIVSVNYLIAASQVSMSKVIICAFLMGVLFSLLLFITYIIRLKLQITLLERRTKKLSAR
ncbi:MAG: LapA family protein [Paraglaciecola sp.]|nr:LapA family protein [Paraglaciecola sp.]NCT49760.1 LapA family protein [Paraglaciecola sp.]